MTPLVMIMLASIAESVVSFAGGALAIFEEERIRRGAHFIVSFAIGALLGVAFLELIPEAIKMAGDLGTDSLIGNEIVHVINFGAVELVLSFVLAGIFLFFVLEKFLFWYHCHDGHCPVHTYTYLILWGDFLHNFIDGIIIALAFLADPRLGIFTTMAVIFHEIPQEIGDFGVLIHGGMAQSRALLYNFFVSLSTILGAVLTYIFGAFLEPILPIALALVAGNFIYLAATDLMPELHESTRLRHSLAQLLFISIGVLLVVMPHFIFE
ncbi:MAG: zinc/iron permease [Parcubacteria group bacterium Gr01-1014_33]|nr:MAG: zinc/iron permease [Parcubacteria group bacterium Gr01-1014_33]